MTENKRFKGGQGEISVVGENLIFKLLGLIAEENQELRTKNNDCLRHIEVYKEENNHLKLENEQLKQDGFYWAETAEARRKEIDKLRKDNSILKQQRDYLFDVIDEVLPHSGSTTVYNRMKNIGDVE